MKTTCTTLLAVLSLTFSAICYGQVNLTSNENPRGVYKLTGIIDKTGTRIKAPFDQYKICTDSVTLMMSVQGNRFSLGKNDRKVFNYTGEEPDAHDATATRIFDSNAEHFTLKWWSTYSSHLIFPNNDWCTEFYESGQYSQKGRLILNALMSSPASDPKNPLVGTWRILGQMDELRDVKKELKRLKENPAKNIYNVITTFHIIDFSGSYGDIYPLEFINKKSIKINLKVHGIKWLTKDIVAIEVYKNDNAGIDYQILERMPNQTVLEAVASRYVIH